MIFIINANITMPNIKNIFDKVQKMISENKLNEANVLLD